MGTEQNDTISSVVFWKCGIHFFQAVTNHFSNALV